MNVELDWLKKKLPRGASELRRWIDPDEPRISIARQCELLGLPRSTYYYSPAAAAEEDLTLMRRIDEQYLRTPFYGSRRMAVHWGEEGFPVNRKRVQRLMRLMGIEAIYPRRTTIPVPGHKVYPLSNTLDTTFCLDALHEALDQYRPNIFNTDQGS